MDVNIIIKRLEYIKEKLKDIKYDLGKYDKVKDERDTKTIQGALERWSEEVVESAVNINNELLLSINKISDSYYNSFMDLKKLNFFDDKLIDKLSNTAGFRNRLAHDYMYLDTKITIESIRNILKLYTKYIIMVYDYIEHLEKKNK